MDRRRAAGALLALAACIACSTAAPTASNQTALELLDGSSEGCYYNFQHYGEGDRIMTNEPCLNCTCHNRMLMCYLKVCPFTKAIGQDCTIEKRADQCCPIVTCPDVPVDLLTSTSTSSPAEYGATGLGKVDKYGCSINGKYFPEGSKVPPTPNKPCEHCYCIRNMTTCVMQECTLHVDGCTPIYHKDVCCPIRYSCDHLEDEMLLLDHMTTTVRPTPGFLLTTTTVPSVTQTSQSCVHDDQIFADGALIKTEIACEHCYCMKGDIVCVVQECGTPMENEGKNCTSLPPRQGQCCPDTYICEGDELLTDVTTAVTYEELTTSPPPRRVEGSGYRNEPDEPYTEIPSFEGSGEDHTTTLEPADMFTSQKQTPQIIDEIFAATEEALKPSLTTIEPDKEQNTVPDDFNESTSDSQLLGKTTLAHEPTTAQPTIIDNIKETDTIESKTTISDYHSPSEADSFITKVDEFIITTESSSHYTKDDSDRITDMKPEIEPDTTELFNIIEDMTTQQPHFEPSSSETSTLYKLEDNLTTLGISILDEMSEPKATTPEVPKDDSEDNLGNKDNQELPTPEATPDKEDVEYAMTPTTSKIESSETTSINPVENEIDEDLLPPGRIPGEGDCLLNGITYKNNTKVPNINNCHSSCKCMSSIVKCDPIICSPPPEHMDNMNDCQPIFDTPDACCPTYVCHSRETIPPESHSQMSGTESPKPASETECHGEQCQPHETKPISPELCNSENCKPVTGDQEKECKDGDCGHIETSISTSPPPLTQPEACIGDACLPSEESCIDGKCQQPIASETICDSENGCQPSEACEGNNCVIGSGVETSSCEGSKCEVSNKDTQVSNEDTVLSDCTEESCRRKDQLQENKSPSECSGSSCISQDVEDTLVPLSPIKDQIYQEPTTEKINDLPELVGTPSGDEYKETQFEITTENLDTSFERSTVIPEVSSAEGLGEIITEKGESESSESHITKIVEPVTDIYNKPQTEDYQTIKPDTDTTKSTEQVTEFIKHVTKETLTESPFATQYEEHPTDLPKEDISDIPTKALGTSTETLDIEQQDHEKDKNDATETSLTEEFIQTQETSTQPTDILATTSKQLETEETEQEYTKKAETFTKSPEEDSTHVGDIMPDVTERQEPTKTVAQDSVNIESQPDVTITESSETLSEITTEKYVEIMTKEDEVTPTVVYNEATNIPDQYITEKSDQLQQSSVPSATGLDETTTNKIHIEIEEDYISTDSPNKFTEVIPTETTAHELNKMTDKETLSVDVDISRETTEISVKDQESLSQPTETYDIVTDKQDGYIPTHEAQDHPTTVSPVIYTTQSAATEENLVKQTDGTPISQIDESTLPESSIKDSPRPTTPHQFDTNESTYQPPEISVTNMQETITETIQEDDISLTTKSDTLKETTDAPIKDFIETSSIKPEETFQEDTAPKEPLLTGPQENEITTNVIHTVELETTPTPISMAGPTIPSKLSDKDPEISTKYTEPVPGIEPSGESTILPEIHSTEESTSLSAETEKKTPETLTSSPLESEAITTETVKETYEDKSEMPEYIHTSGQTQEISIGESTLAPMPSYTDREADSSDKTIPISMDDNKTKEEPSYATPDTIKHITDEQVTKSFENNITVTDSSYDIHKPTEHTVSDEIEAQTFVTEPSKTITQSQETVTNLATELQPDQDMSTIPAHVTKEEKGQTEYPMSLITEASPLMHPDENREYPVDKTTDIPQTNAPGEEEIKLPNTENTKPQISYTDSPQLSETEIPVNFETSSQTYPEKESQPESSFTLTSPEYTTVKVLDIQDKEKTASTYENTYIDMSTVAAEKLTPPTQYQDVTQKPNKTDLESYSTDVLHESTSKAPVIVSSEESFATEEQELSTRYPEIIEYVPTVTYDHEADTKPETIPIKEDTTDALPPHTTDFTTPGSKTSETLKEDHEDTQTTNDVTVNIQESEHTVLPELVTTAYPETLDDNEDKKIDEHKPSKQEEHTLAPEQPVTPGIDIQSSVSEYEDKSTEMLQTGDKGATTPVYQDLITLKEESMGDVPEAHLSTITTESSEILPSDESNRRTLSPTLENVQPVQQTNEQQKITELPEMTKTEEIEKTEKTQDIPTKLPEEEGVTRAPVSEQFDGVTSIPQVTESDILLQTETDQELPIVTEDINKHTVETQDVTLKPDTEVGDGEDYHTEYPYPPTTEKDEITDKTTVPDDLTKIPVDTMPVEIPSEHTVEQELQTETSIPKETEILEATGTETPVALDTQSEISVSIVTETYIPKATEPSTLKESEIVPPEVTQASIPEKTEDATFEMTEASVSHTSLPHEIEVSVPEVTKASLPTETEVSVSEVTEASVPKETEVSISEATETSLPEETEVSMSDLTETPISKETEASVSEVTQASVPKETEVSVSEATETSLQKETETSMSHITEAPVSKETEASVSEVTQASIPKETEISVSEVTEASVTKETEASLPDITEASVPNETDASLSEATEASSIPKETEASSVYKETEASTPEPTETFSGPKESEPSVHKATEASVPEITKTSAAEVTEATITEVTEASVSGSDSSVPKETVNEIMNKEPEGATYKPKDETEALAEQSPTVEPIHSSSETTPYFVELQEHTTKVDDDITSITLTEDNRTEDPEKSQTERGDQPVDNFSDTFTKEDSFEEYTTKETITKKDEQLPTQLPEQASEYPEKIPEITEIATEITSISSESPGSSLSDSQSGQNIPSSEEQSVTMTPIDSITLKQQDKFTIAVNEIEATTDRKVTLLDTEKTPEHDITHEATDSEDSLIPTITKATTIKTTEEFTTRLPIVEDKFTRPEDKPIEPYSPTTAPELSKPGINDIQPTEEIPAPDFPPSGSSGYGQEPDYVEEDQAFGPGTCRYGGKVYVSAQQIPRDDPCDFCFCFRSDIICLQQSCPPPIHGCHEEPIQGFCCPRYECPVSMATTLNVTTTTTTTTTTLPPHFLPHAYKGAAQRRGCQIKGHSYKVGEVVRASSGPCLHCTCGGDGQMKCDPKACTPEPMLRQMIAAAVSAKRRR